MKRIIPPVVVLIILTGVFLWYRSQPGSAATSDRVEASGNIEATEYAVVSEVGGRVTEVRVDAGAEVSAGEVLLQLDPDLLLAQRDQAQADLDAARARLDLVKAGARPTTLAQAEVAVDKAIALRNGVERAWQNSIVLRNNPQDMKLQLQAAQTRLTTAGHQVEAAKSQIELAKVQRDQYKNPSTEYWAAQQQVDAAEAQLAAAEANRDGAARDVQNWQSMIQNPIPLNTQVNAAKAQLDLATQGVEAARATLAVLQAQPRAEEVQAAEAQVSQALAALEAIQVRLDKLTLKSPAAGLVTSRVINAGETVNVGMTLLTIADLDEVKLAVFIPEPMIARVKIGQLVAVKVDSFPGRTFTGRVTFISSQAEFTPKNVQTKAERVNTVFAVKIALDNPDHALKPGMPADATFQ